MYTNLMHELGAAGMTINELASLTGISERALQNRLQGKNDFSLQQMCRIQRVLPGCSLDVLFDAGRGRAGAHGGRL